MKLTISFLLISSALLFSPTAKAVDLTVDPNAPTLDLSFSGVRDATYKQVYDYYKYYAYGITREMCQSIVNTSRAPIMLNTFFKGLWAGDDLNLFSKSNPSIQGLIDSDGYWEALEDCYGRDPASIDIFTAQLYVADWASRSLSVALVSGAAASVLAGAQNLLTLALTKTGLIAKFPLFAKSVSTAFQLITLAPAVPLTITLVREKYRIKKFMKDPLNGMNEAFKALHEDDEPIIAAAKVFSAQDEAVLDNRDATQEQKAQARKRHAALTKLLKEREELESLTDRF